MTMIKSIKEDETVSVPVNQGLAPSVKLVGLYFSMHTCPPCRVFTPLLAEIYREINEQSHQFEVIFFSNDKT